MKQGKSKVIPWLFGFLILTGAVYLLISAYYRNGYSINTWMNGVYCTGKTAAEVNSELLSQIEAPIVTVTDKDGICCPQQAHTAA